MNNCWLNKPRIELEIIKTIPLLHLQAFLSTTNRLKNMQNSKQNLLIPSKNTLPKAQITWAKRQKYRAMKINEGKVTFSSSARELDRLS